MSAAIILERHEAPRFVKVPGRTVPLMLERPIRSIRMQRSGIPGVSGAATIAEMEVASPLIEWVFNHNLGRRPAAVTVLSPGGVEMDAEVVNMSPNQIRVYFATPQAGSIRAI